MAHIVLYLIGLIAIAPCFIQGLFDESIADCYLTRKRSIRILECPKLVNDPQFKNQWMLVPRPYAEYGNRTTVDLGILDVWIKHNIFGENVIVAVNDDGVEAKHPEFKTRYNSFLSYNYIDNNWDPKPRGADFHGTPVAGIVAMEMNNGKCGVGVAPKVTIAVGRVMYANPSSIPDSVTCGGLSARCKDIDITINSYAWNAGSILVIPFAILSALEESSLIGRGGLGTIHVFAAGNYKRCGNTCSFDRYSQNIYTITVAAITPWGETSEFSSRCSAVMVAAPSSPLHPHFFITAANGKQCTSAFGGTSGSTPIVGGILALGVQANRNMTWRDWQHALAYSSSHENVFSHSQSSFKKNGAGLYVSLDFGFGLINALRLVETAMFFRNVPPMHTCRIQFPVYRNVFDPPDIFIESIESDGCIDSPNDLVYYLEHVQVKLSMTYHYFQELSILLTSPMGTDTQILAKQWNYSQIHASADHNWIFDSVQTWGEYSIGTWTIFIEDESNVPFPGFINSLELILHGTAEKPMHYTHFY